MKFDINSKNENLLGANTTNSSFNTGAKQGSRLSHGLNMGGLNIKLKNSFSNLKGANGQNSFRKELLKAKEQELPVHIEKLESVKVERDDAVFFLNLIENKNLGAEVLKNEKSANVSKNLIDLLHKANDTKKPVRIDFDNKITLVLKVEQDGRLNAQFFPGDKAAEEYLKNNIPFLKQQFDEKEIKYSSLNYHSQRDKKEKQK